MTREELIQMYSKYSKSAIFDILIKTIDDFESRTCENCKHNKEEDGGFIFCEAEMPTKLPTIMGWHLFGKNFGCNKFERKEV